MNLRPLSDRVLVELVEAEERTPGGIIRPDTAKEKPQRGTVVAVGDGKIAEDGTRIPVEVREGDEVIFGKYAGEDLKIKGKDYKILRAGDILARVRKS